MPLLQEHAKELDRQVASLQKAIDAIPAKADDEKVKAHRRTTKALAELRQAIAAAERRLNDLKAVEREVESRTREGAQAIELLRAKFPSLLTEADWESLKPSLGDTGRATLARHQKKVEANIGALRAGGLTGDQNQGLALLARESERLSKELGLDEARTRRRTDLETRLASMKAQALKAQEKVALAKGAEDRLRDAQRRRLEGYRAVLQALEAEEEVLLQLYSPLRQRLEADPHLAKLGLRIRRVVDVRGWASRGERLVDLRKHPFGSQSLEEAASEHLLAGWKEGDASAASGAMGTFLEAHGRKAVASLREDVSAAELGEWVFSTDHIGVRYSIEHEGVEIGRLSPGSGGGVLLALYLALDDEDPRPLVIDQPEENLDPSTIYEDLVPLFRQAARRRQIIVVTHNANLVVNADCDQVIIARARRESAVGLPLVSYASGGLEDAEVRSHVCQLLEGGEEAFRRRGQRYGVQ